VSTGGELEDSSSAPAFARAWFVLLRSCKTALFEASKCDEDGRGRHWLSRSLLEFHDYGRAVSATAQPLQGQHDVVLEFTECDTTHHSPH